MGQLVKRLRIVVRAFGFTGLLRRIKYVALLRMGAFKVLLRQQPSFAGARRIRWGFSFDLERLRSAYADLGDEVSADCCRFAERIIGGQTRLYGWAWKDVGWPPRWHDNPFTGHNYPQVHWAHISDFDPEAGDIKDVWELGRLPFTFAFARAYAATSDERYAREWWNGIEDWAKHNPPNTGVHWRCGQETSLRGIAICFGLSVFRSSPETTPMRRELAERILGASVRRVRPTLGYALSQRNNHAVSELVFLISVVGPTPLLCSKLERVIEDQFYPDGSYAQQSFNYQRLAVQVLQWLLLTRPDLPAALVASIHRVQALSRTFLARCSDPVTRRLPNYGPNDDSHLFPLNAADNRDFRPFLASIGAHPSSPHDREQVAWLNTHAVEEWPAVEEGTSTYVTMRGPRSMLLTRIGTGQHRPGHGDQQAIDLWIDGHNLVVDPGTYRYTAPRPWGNALRSARVHSTVIAAKEQAVAVGRFLSLEMTPAELVAHEVDGDVEVVISKRAVPLGMLWRVIVRTGDAYTVADFADGVSGRVRWNLDLNRALRCLLGDEESVEGPRATDDDPESGWFASRYGHREKIAVQAFGLEPGDVAVARFSRREDHALGGEAFLTHAARHVPGALREELGKPK